MSASNRIQLAYKKESTYGTAPSGDYQILRKVTHDLTHNATYEESDEAREDRQNSDEVNTDISGGGSVDGELSFGTYDDWFQWALQSAAAPADVVHTTTGSTFDVAAVASNGGTITRTAGGSDWTSDIVVGRWVKIVTPLNSCLVYVVSRSATVLTVRGKLLTAETGVAGASMTVTMVGYWTIGTTMESMAIESWHKDVTAGAGVYPYDLLTGMIINTFGLSVRAGQKSRINWGLVGQRGTAKTAATPSGYTATTTSRIMTGIRHVQCVMEDYKNATANLATQELTVNLNNNIATEGELGALGPTLITPGNGVASGTLVAVHSAANSALQHKYDQDIETSLAMVLLDSNVKGYALEWPAVKLRTSKRPSAGKNQTCKLDVTWGALRDSTDISFRMHRAA